MSGGDDTDRVPDGFIAIVNPNSPDAHAMRALVNARESSKPAAPPPVDDGKRWATLQARCALAGLAVTRSQDDAGRTVYIASKWALTRQCADLDEVEQLLRTIGGPSA